VLETLEPFLAALQSCLRHPHDRERADAVLRKWSAAWQGPRRALEYTRSNHGACLHFNQLVGTVWSHAFSFHAVLKRGLFLRGPDTDRQRKSHKFRANPLDTTGLDALFEAWSAHPEARPANNAVELHLLEASDEVWAQFLQDALRLL
jgi:hypothetical protein